MHIDQIRLGRRRDAMPQQARIELGTEQRAKDRSEPEGLRLHRQHDVWRTRCARGQPQLRSDRTRSWGVDDVRASADWK